ncbi:MAG: lipopolysaccharide biosynthesis protein [Christensenellaceae bacterium]
MESRFQNSLRNVVFGLAGQIINIIMSFALRTVLNNAFSLEILGVNGTFTNILMVFSLADLGVGTAIIFALYRPIAEGDIPKIQSLMKMYKKAYITIGCVIMAMGLALMPFIHSFVKSETPIPNLQLIFMIFVFNTAATYFFSYKGTLITAHQKNYIVTNVVYATSVLCYIIQILVVKLTHNYILSLTIQAATNALQGIITMIIANRMFPYLKDKNIPDLSKGEKQKIYRNMGSLMFYRTGQVVINGTDSLLISSLVDASIAGLYSNYSMITVTIKNLLQQVFNAVTASIGNLAVVESDERKYEIYNVLYFVNFWLFGFAAVCLVSLLTPFIRIWVGAEKMMDMLPVILVVLNFYLVGMRNVNIVFRDAMGVFKEGRFVPITSAIINVGVSIVCTIKLGLIGAFLGTTISMVCTLVWMEPVVLFRHGFKRSPWPYFKQYTLYFVAVVAASVIAIFLTRLVPGHGLLSFLLKGLIAVITPNLFFALLFWRTKEFQMLYRKLGGMLKKRMGRRA